jgi:glycosyltransferase involved in cell wall biosynthesis
VSVVIPAYDAERFIAVSLTSLRGQSLQNWDAWIVDDGSADRTLEIARSFADEDARLHVLTQPNSGTPAIPRNRAIASSRGPFVSFLDPDDFYLPGRLERQLEVMRGVPEVDMVFSDPILVDSAGRATGERYLERVGYLSRARPHLDAVGANLYVSRASFFAFTSAEVAGPSTSGVMVRRTALERQGRWFAEDLSVGEDLDLWFRIIERGRVAFVDEPLNAYRQHPASLMNAGVLTARDSARAHIRNYSRARRYLNAEQRRSYRRRIAALHFDVAYRHRLAGRGDQARTAYRRSLWWRPELRTALAWLKTLVPPRTSAASVGEPGVQGTDGPR